VIVTPSNLPLACKREYTECLLLCWNVRDAFYSSARDFWRADADFWDNFLTGRSYLNSMSGGPRDRMNSSFRQMQTSANSYRANNCARYR
jgi:hypothetical protein